MGWLLGTNKPENGNGGGKNLANRRSVTDATDQIYRQSLIQNYFVHRAIEGAYTIHENVPLTNNIVGLPIVDSKNPIKLTSI